jgi:hypothetical protein
VQKTKNRGTSTSQCTPLREIIQGGLKARLSAQRIYQDLVIEHGFTGSYDGSVKRFARSLGNGNGNGSGNDCRIMDPGKMSASVLPKSGIVP